MLQFKSVEEIFDYAITREKESADFYFYLAKQMHKAEMRQMFDSLATEELGHKSRLELLKKKNLHNHIHEKAIDLIRITEYVPDEPKEHDFNYRNAITIAMNREKMSYKLYRDLADSTDSLDLHDTFIDLSMDEAQHKLKFEIELDELSSQ